MSQRSERLERRREFQRQVVALDGMCMGCFKVWALGAHHIVHKRPNAKELDVVENGIALCPECHTKAHTGYKCTGAWYEHGRVGEYISPRQFMIELLESLRDPQLRNDVYRWDWALAELQKRQRSE